MKTMIYGAGAMGTVLGAYLAKAGEDILLVTRNKSHVEGLQKHGAQITGTATFTQQVKVCLPEEIQGTYDIVLLMTKQIDNIATVKSLLPKLEKDGVICTMQNGLPELSVAEVLGMERTYGCAMAWGATMLGEGRVEMTSAADRASLTFSLGSFHTIEDPHFEEIQRLLSIMGEVTVEKNFLGARWAKLLVNSAFSGLSAVLGATFGEIANHKISRRLAQMSIKESIDVAHADHIHIEPIQGKDAVKLLNYNGPIKRWISYQLIPIAMKKHGSIRSSMLQDLEKGRKTEIEAINGVVCQYGDKVGVETPVTDRIVEIVHRYEQGDGKPGWEKLILFEDLLST